MKLELRDQEIALLQFCIKASMNSGESRVDRYVVVDEEIVGNEFEYMLTHAEAGVFKMQALNLNEDNDKFWLLYNSDCYSPPMYLIRSPDESDAVEEFLDKTDICTISEADLPDYFSPDGEEVAGLFYAQCDKKCDISQLQCVELELLVVITKQGIKAISGTLGHDKLPKIVPLKAKAPMHGHRVLDIT